MVKASRQELIIKMCCFIAACCLWLYTSNDTKMSRIDKIANVPVEVANSDSLIKSGLVLSPNQSFSVSLKISGTPADVYSVKASEFKVVADLSGYALKKGDNKIPVTIVKRSNKNINILNDDAMWINVEVDEYSEKTFSVKTKVTGDNNGTYKEVPIVSPNSVTVSGAKEYVDRVKAVYAEIKVGSQQQKIDVSVPLKAVDNDENEVEEVSLSPKYSNVIMDIEKTKQVPIKIQTKGQLNSKLKLKTIKLNSNQVVITGEPKQLESITQIETEPLDLSAVTSDNPYVKLKLIIPQGIKLVKGEEVIDAQVVFETDVAEAEKTINLKIETRNLDSSLVAKLENYNVTLKVSGNKEVIDKLTTSDIECFADLQGLKEGEHSIPVNIILPEGVNKVSQSVENVKVNIEKETSTSKPENGDNGNTNGGDNTTTPNDNNKNNNTKANNTAPITN